MFKVGVFAIIFNKEDKVLLCHRRDYDLWNLPGGGLEKGEAPWQGVIREVQEETGLEVKIERLSGIYFKPQKDEIVFAFVCKIISGKISLTDEADKIEYFSINNFPQNFSPKQAERIKDALLKKRESVLKIQTGLSSVGLFSLEKKTAGENFHSSTNSKASSQYSP